MYDVILICTHLKKFEAASRRIVFFTNFLIKNKIKAKIVGFKVITNRGIVTPDVDCATVSLLISTRSLVSSILNIVLTFPITIYIMLLRPKVIVISIPDFYPLLSTYIGAKLSKAKLIIDIRDPVEATMSYSIKKNIIERTILKMILRLNYLLYARVNALLAVTNSLKKLLEEKIGREVILVPNGADLSIFKPIEKSIARRKLSLDNNQIILAYIGLIGGYYSFKNLIRCIKDINSNGANLKLLLAGPIVDNCEADILNSPEFKNFTTYLGILDLEETRLLLSSANLGIIPRVDNPLFNYALPVKFYEYLACGLPVLALSCRESELSKCILDNNLGFVCEPYDITCIKKTLETIVSNRDLLRQYRINVLRFRRKIDRKIGAGTLINIIRKLLT